MARNKQAATTDPKSFLDQEAKMLATRHRERLATMTGKAVAHGKPSQGLHLNPRLSHGFGLAQWHRPAAALGLAFTLVITATLVVFKPEPEQPAQTATMEQHLIPQWVEDDAVPVSLLENMDLYVWIAQQSSPETQG